MKIQIRIFLSMIILILFIFLFFGFLFYSNYKEQLIQQIIDENITISKMIELVYEKNTKEVFSISQVRSFFSKHGFKWMDDYIVIISHDRSIEFSNKQLTNEGRLKIINLYNKYLDQFGYFNLVDYLNEDKKLFTLYKNDKIDSFDVLIISDLSVITNFEKKFLYILIQSIIISLIMSIVIAALMSRNLIKNIIKLRNAIIEAKNLNFEKKVDVKSKDEIGIIAEEYNKLIDKINLYNESQKRFLQNVSHELKTPLTSIRGYAEMIKTETDNSVHIDGLNVIIRQVDKLKNIINQIINLSKIESLKEVFRFEQVDLNDLIFDVLINIEGIIFLKDIEVTFNPKDKIFIYADKEKFSEAIINILSNCIRYAKSRIDIDVQVINGKFNLKIIDDGPGFLDKDVDKIFERFYKGSRGESGLGLSISKTIIEKHNMEIKAENNKNGGALFVIIGKVIAVSN
ncbi:ATP-binding protein [Caldicellulosiruptoraceae bacterium PP1]